MRFVFLVALLANVALYGYGTGLFGPPPSARGREPQRLQGQVHPEAVVVAGGEDAAPR